MTSSSTPLPYSLADSALSGIAVPIFESILRADDNLFVWLYRKLNSRESQEKFRTAFSGYEQRYKQRHGLIKLLGMTEPIDIESIFTPIQVWDQKATRYIESIQALEPSSHPSRRRERHAFGQPKKDALDFANQEQYMMVRGGPGSGKTTFLKKMGLEALKSHRGKLKHSCIPVFIELKHFDPEQDTLEQIIEAEFRVCGIPEADQFAAKALQRGKLLILLDGLDEAPINRLDKALIQIRDFVRRYHRNRFIASCRLAADYSSFLNFTEVEIAAFDDAQIVQFLRNWFHSTLDEKSKTVQQFCELLRNSTTSGPQELTHNPLLLTLLCFIYDTSQNLPRNRSILCEESLDLFMHKWQVEKRVQRNPIYQDLNLPIEKAMLSELAYQGFEANRLFFSKEEVFEKIKTFLTENLNAPACLDGEGVLKAIEIQQGILVEPAQNVYSFSHLTFQEYLTAQYIDDHHQVDQLVAHHLLDRRWRDVFLLVAGLMRAGADELLLLMEKELQTFINTSNLRNLLGWSNKISERWNPEFSPVAKRAAALDIAGALAFSYMSMVDRPETTTTNSAHALKHARWLTRCLNSSLDSSLSRPRKIVRLSANCDALNDYKKRIQALGKEFRQQQIFNNINLGILRANLEKLKSQVPSHKQPNEMSGVFAKRVWRTWLQAFHLDPKWLQLAPEEVQALRNYLYVNTLMVECKQASVRVSRSNWEKIEAHMLQADGVV